MISFEIPHHVLDKIEFYRDVAENAMRPSSRWLDDNEHERPIDYINVMWPLVKKQYGEKIAQLKSGETPKQIEGADWDRLVTMVGLSYPGALHCT